ncbi:interleukin-4 receptor subunit alpha-like [Pteropus medius]|uniref:interleukin-4 receptor subunit alpha-like n=1 Tax=Pteropus vampyrus TaxID=132908 RepID=UPI00196A8328|nr:interleukin-4 receptor subunit alpha-like [Pteropus giganteus]
MFQPLVREPAQRCGGNGWLVMGQHQVQAEWRGGSPQIKKTWWDQIPSPAHSPGVAVVIRESQPVPHAAAPALRSWTARLEPEAGWTPGGKGPQHRPCPSALQPEPDTWEQVLRGRFLQAAAAPARGPAGGCRGSCRRFRRAAGLAPSGDAECKAFSSRLTSGAICPAMPGIEASGGEGAAGLSRASFLAALGPLPPSPCLPMDWKCGHLTALRTHCPQAVPQPDFGSRGLLCSEPKAIRQLPSHSPPPLAPHTRLTDEEKGLAKPELALWTFCLQELL